MGVELLEPMVQFLDLPLELLPVILQNILRPCHLATACLVSKHFYAFAAPKLYERPSFFSWHKRGKLKAIQLFVTLSHCPHLAKYVRALEIRDFPKALTTAVTGMGDTLLQGMQNCVNLRSCTWTRDGSLSSAILEALQKCDTLEDLEINGRNIGNYNPDLLLGFTHLRKISLIMPTPLVIDTLSPWLGITGATLRDLTLICKARASAIVTDAVLVSLAPNLVELRRLHIAGCPKVTERGIWALVSINADGIVGLSLEGLSPKFDMLDFSRRCANSGALASLRSITLTVNQQSPLQTWMQGVLTLLAPAPLEIFQVYSTGAMFEEDTTDSFWASIVTAHGARLTRFSVHRMIISVQAIDDICQRCTALEQLFVVVDQETLATLGCSLLKASKLRTLHINYPLAYTDHPSSIDPLALLRHCSPTVTQFGCNVKVWQVDRVVIVDEEGRISTEPRLAPYQNPDIPEQFLIVRT